MTCDRFRPSSLMRSVGSVDALGASAFAAGGEAGWLGRAEVAAGWARKPRTGIRHVIPRRTVVLSSRRMVAGLRKDGGHWEQSAAGLTAGRASRWGGNLGPR